MIKYKIVRGHLVKELIQKKKDLIHKRTNIMIESFKMTFHICTFKSESIISLMYAVSHYPKY